MFVSDVNRELLVTDYYQRIQEIVVNSTICYPIEFPVNCRKSHLQEPPLLRAATRNKHSQLHCE